MEGEEPFARAMARGVTAQGRAKPAIADGALAPCRCACFAHGTLIATSEGMKAIEEFAVGDTVLVATPDAAGDGRLSWSPSRVIFSVGTGPGSGQPVMVYVQYGDGQSTVVTHDHLFLMPDGTLQSADRLVPGHSQFVLAQGGTTPIVASTVASYAGGIHHIGATEIHFDGRLDGHLLNANGIVSGDYVLQMRMPGLGLGSAPKGCASPYLLHVLGFIRRWIHRLRCWRQR